MRFFLALIAFFLLLETFGQDAAIKIQPKGLRPDSVYFVVGDKKVNDNSFPEGTKLYMHFQTIKGFAVKNGMSFPGCSMKVTDLKGKTILDHDDLFTDTTGVSNKDAKYMDLSLTIGAPMAANQTYRWDTRIWDKITKSEVIVSATIKVGEAKDALGIKRNSQGLTCESTIVMKESPLTSNKVREGDELTFVISGLKGFTLNKMKEVNLGASIKVKDPIGNYVVEMSDLMKDDASYALDIAETIRLSLTIGDPMLADTKYMWEVRVWDKNSKKSIEASVLLEVVN